MIYEDVSQWWHMILIDGPSLRKKSGSFSWSFPMAFPHQHTNGTNFQSSGSFLPKTWKSSQNPRSNMVKCLPEARTCAMSWVIHHFGPKKRGNGKIVGWDEKKNTKWELRKKMSIPPPKKKDSLKWQTPKSSKRIDNIDIYSENQWFFGVPQV